jgi:hypothetical protein
VTSLRDIGKQAVEQVAAIWQVDPARCIQREDGFDWWPGDFRVAVTTHGRNDRQNPDSCGLTIRTDLLKDVPIEDQRVAELVALMARSSASTYAWVYPPAEVWSLQASPSDRPKLWSGSTANLTTENADWLPGFLALMSLLQPIDAQLLAAEMAELLPGATPDVSSPGGMKLKGLDPILGFAANVYAPIGNEQNRWVGTGEFEAHAERWGRSELCFGTGDAQGLTMEVPFGQDSALISLQTDRPHPQLGTGLLGTIQLPIHDEFGLIAHECARLNFMETFWTDIPLFGCWNPHTSRDGKDYPAFTSFVPNCLYQPGLASHLAAWLVRRARWVRTERFPQLRDRTMLEILNERLGIAGNMSDQIRSGLH